MQEGGAPFCTHLHALHDAADWPVPELVQPPAGSGHVPPRVVLRVDEQPAGAPVLGAWHARVEGDGALLVVHARPDRVVEDTASHPLLPRRRPADPELRLLWCARLGDVMRGIDASIGSAWRLPHYTYHPVEHAVERAHVVVLLAQQPVEVQRAYRRRQARQTFG